MRGEERKGEERVDERDRVNKQEKKTEGMRDRLRQKKERR